MLFVNKEILMNESKAQSGRATTRLRGPATSQT